MTNIAHVNFDEVRKMAMQEVKDTIRLNFFYCIYVGEILREGTQWYA